MSLDRNTLNRLAPRQYEIWLLLTKGFTTKGVAERLFITQGTVAQTAHLIGQILGTAHRGLWMKLAIEEGIIPCQIPKLQAPPSLPLRLGALNDLLSSDSAASSAPARPQPRSA